MAYPTNWKRKEEESASGGKYHALDSSGNNYAGLSGMDELSQAALEAAQSSWQSANKAGDQEGMDAAHQQAESIRSKYGYSGGADGSQYLPTGSGTKQAAFSYESAPSYTSRYQNQIDELTSAILNREAFSYDPETDPLYDQYKEQYTREGQRAMQDALGRYRPDRGPRQLLRHDRGGAGQQLLHGPARRQDPGALPACLLHVYGRGGPAAL